MTSCTRAFSTRVTVTDPLPPPPLLLLILTLPRRSSRLPLPPPEPTRGASSCPLPEELTHGARAPRQRPRRAGPDAGADAGPRGPGRQRGLQRGARRVAVATRPLARGRPDDRALLRPGRPRDRRALVHRPPPRHRRRRRPARHRLARAGLDDLLPGLPRRPARGAAASPLRLRPRPHHRDGGRAPPRRRRAGRAARRSSRARSSVPASGRCATSSRRSSPSRTRSCASTSTTTVCIQGAPGTGKTAVGLHRAAWLLYAYRERLTPQRRPRRRPEPGLPRAHRRGPPDPRRGRGAAHEHRGPHRVGAGPRRRAHRGRPAQGRRPDGRGAPPCRLVAPRPDRPRRWSCRAGHAGGGSPAYDIAPLVDGLAGRDDPLRRRPRSCSPQRLAHAVLVQMEALGEYPDDRVQDAVARSAPGQGVCRVALAQGRRRAGCCTGCCRDPAGAGGRRAKDVLTAEEQQLLLWEKPSRTAGSAQWTLADTCAARRAGRPAQPHAEPRSRRARRGAGPLADAAARGRPTVLDRGGHRPRRHRAGHDPVVDGVVGGEPAHLGKPRGRRLRAAPRVPRARQRHRVRRPAAPARRARAGGAGVGA